MSSILSRLKQVAEDEQASIVREKREEQERQREEQMQSSQDSNPWMSASDRSDRFKRDKADITYLPLSFREVPPSCLVWVKYTYWRPKHSVSVA
jgi:hypothetical protein